MRPRILHVENGLGMGGATSCLRGLVGSAQENGYEVFVAISYEDPQTTGLVTDDHLWNLAPFVRRIVPSQPPENSRSKIARWYGRATGTLGNSYGHWRQDRPLARYLEERLRWHDISLVHTNNSLLANRAAIDAARRAGVPVVAHQRGWEWACGRVRRLSRTANRIIAVSDAVQRQLESLVENPAAVIRVYDGVDSRHFRPDASRKDSARLEMGFAPHQVVVGFLASHLPWKGHDLFLRAFSVATRRVPHLRALVVGSRPKYAAPMKPDPRATATELNIQDRVTWVEHLEDPRTSYAACDLVVHASTQPEPLGLVVLEAMSCGLPVIASSVGGPAETVLEGITGMLYPQNDRAALCERIVELSLDENLRHRLGAAGRERAERSYSTEDCARAVHAAYREVLEQGRVARTSNVWHCEPSHS